MSVVVDFMRTVYQEANAVGGHSWQNLNSAMQKALLLCITARFKFEVDDFSTIANSKMGYEFWAGTDNRYSQGESFYSVAVGCNKSAAISFEHHKGRKPFIFMGKRLAMGDEFVWWPCGNDKPEPGSVVMGGATMLPFERIAVRWYCTSFAEDGSYINCSCYVSPENKEGWRNNAKGGPTRRMQLTVKDLKQCEQQIRGDVSHGQAKR